MSDPVVTLHPTDKHENPTNKHREVDGQRFMSDQSLQRVVARVVFTRNQLRSSSVICGMVAFFPTYITDAVETDMLPPPRRQCRHGWRESADTLAAFI